MTRLIKVIKDLKAAQPRVAKVEDCGSRVSDVEIKDYINNPDDKEYAFMYKHFLGRKDSDFAN